MNDKILVTIANYNHSRFLRESIKSITNQTYENLDICVIDDMSIDQEKVSEIVNSFKDSRIRYIKNNKNMGKWWCLNEAIKTTDAIICTSHDADDISLRDRIEKQYLTLKQTNTVHNLCSFYHCFNEKELKEHSSNHNLDEKISIIEKDRVFQLVTSGYLSPHVNHYFTGNIETAGTSAMFYKQVWDLGIRFNPPKVNLRVLISEDSDFNFRCTSILRNTSILTNKLYCYRRNTSTNKEEI